MASKNNTKRTRLASQPDQKSMPKKKTSRDDKIQAIEHPIKEDFTRPSEFLTLAEETLNGYKELACRLFKQCVEELPPDTIIKSPEAKSSIKALKNIFKPVVARQKKEIAIALEDLAWNMGCQLPVISLFSSSLELYDDRDNIDDEIVLEECKRGIIAFISEVNRCRSIGLNTKETNKALKKHIDWYLDLYRKQQNASLLDEAVRQLTYSKIISKDDSIKFNDWSLKCSINTFKEKNDTSELQSIKGRYPWRQRHDQKQKTIDASPSPTIEVKEQLSTERENMLEDEKRAQHREFWTDHSKGWNDDSNKKQAHFQARIPRETDIRINAFLKATGMKKISLTNEALNTFINNYEYSDKELDVLRQELNLK